ncbi:MAG: hypothetical protein JW708_02140 [Vallitaleaceae bacterium]|nr:hypothetical protein [Vallitaleaceae bacterium]
MSILRQRQKNLLLAGTIGFFIALVIIGGVIATLFMSGYQIPERYIKQQEIIEEPRPLVVKKSVYLFMADVKKDELLQQNQFQIVELEEQFVPENAITDLQQIEHKCTKSDTKKNTLLTSDLFYDPNLFKIDSDIVEINDLYLPSHLEVGDEVNIRIAFPSGQDYLVVGGKEVKAINSEKTKMYLDLSEEEILNLSSARVDCTIFPSTKLYFTKKSSVFDLKEAEVLATMYPMNPNVYKMAYGEYQDDGITTKRIDLDLSLFEYFDEDLKMYQYAFEELSEEEQKLYLSYQENLEKAIEESVQDIPQESAVVVIEESAAVTTQESVQETAVVSEESTEVIVEEVSGF